MMYMLMKISAPESDAEFLNPGLLAVPITAVRQAVATDDGVPAAQCLVGDIPLGPVGTDLRTGRLLTAYEGGHVLDDLPCAIVADLPSGVGTDLWVEACHLSIRDRMITFSLDVRENWRQYVAVSAPIPVSVCVEGN